MPFSLAVDWFLTRILSPVTRVTPSINWPFAKLVARVPGAVVAARTDCFHLRPAIEASIYVLVAF